MKSYHSALWIMATLFIAVAPYCAAQATWKPEKVAEIVVGSSPGGGNDKTARTLQRIWQDSKWLENAIVLNKTGGGGAVAYGYVSQHARDAHYLAVARMGFLTNHILGRSAISYTEMTPLALMGSEPTVFAVRADSPTRTVADLIERLRADPQSVSVSLGSTRGSTTHFALARVARAAGVDARRLKVVTFSGGAQSVTNVLGGHVDMMSASVDNAVPQHRAGKLRIIGIATEKRAPSLPDVPTLKEQGYDVVIGGWLAIIGPGGLAPSQVAYWESLLERTANDARWKRYLEEGSVEWHFLKSGATRDYLKREYDMAQSLLTELGLKK